MANSLIRQIASHSLRLAELTNEVPQLAKAFAKMAQGVMLYAQIHGLRIEDVRVAVGVNDGQIVVSIYG